MRNDIDLCLTLNEFAKSILVQAGFTKDKIKVRGNSLPDIHECKQLEGKHY